MRIVIESSILQEGICGTSRSIIGLYDASARQDPSLCIEAVHNKPLAVKLPSTIKDVKFGNRYLHQFFWRYYSFPHYNEIEKPDAIHFPYCAFHVKQPLLKQGIITFFSNGRGNIKTSNSDSLVVLTIHDIMPIIMARDCFKNDKEKYFYEGRMQADIERSDLIVTPSEASKRDIVKYFRLKNEPVVIYHGNDLADTLITSSDITSDKEYFLYVGGAAPRKLDILVPLYRELYVQKMIDIPLVFVGKNFPMWPKSSELDKALKKAVACGAIEQRGCVTDEELAALYRNAVALIYPSRYEGFGLPPIEAMSQGCPVITTKAGSLFEICGDAAYYVEVGSKESLAKAIIEMRKNSELRGMLRKKGELQAKKYSWDISAKKYLEALRSLKIKY